jgi:Cu-Zn family superoxide dismutase
MVNRSVKAFLFLGTTAFYATACGLLGGSSGPAAEATLRDAQGVEVATATLRQNGDNSVTIEVRTTRVAAGTHGIHIHAVGSCTAPSFTDAGAHFNPSQMKHGLENGAGPHNGDLANLVVGADGRAEYKSSTSRVTLTPGASSLFDADGSAVVIHATADDQRTDPSGNSGARIACGVVHAR